jgi:hypothetical protein
MDQNLKWNEIYSILFYFLNWYKMFQTVRIKENKTDTLDTNVSA